MAGASQKVLPTTFNSDAPAARFRTACTSDLCYANMPVANDMHPLLRMRMTAHEAQPGLHPGAADGSDCEIKPCAGRMRRLTGWQSAYSSFYIDVARYKCCQDFAQCVGDL